MDYFQAWGEHTHSLPISMCIIMFLIMAVCIFIFLRRRLALGNRRFYRFWGRGLFATCCGPDRFNTPLDILRERYASGEINKEEFEEMKRDISQADKS